jgi:hypothetical protein
MIRNTLIMPEIMHCKKFYYICGYAPFKKRLDRGEMILFKYLQKLDRMILAHYTQGDIIGKRIQYLSIYYWNPATPFFLSESDLERYAIYASTKYM